MSMRSVVGSGTCVMEVPHTVVIGVDDHDQAIVDPSATPPEPQRTRQRWHRGWSSVPVPLLALLTKLSSVKHHPATRFLLLVCLYITLCALLLCIALLYTPLGLQGKHASNLSKTAVSYAREQWESYDARLPRDDFVRSTNPSGSFAAASLQAWKMVAPPAPSDDESVPVSPPNNAKMDLLPQMPIDPLYSASKPNYPLGDSFALVTFASSVYYERLLNLIGSVHFWEPTQRVVVYDLGFTQEQVLELQCVDNIELRPFNFTAYPPHVKNLFQYFFKPLLVYDALQHASAVLVLDSGIELRQQLRGIKEHMERDGYFLAGQPNTIGRKSMAETFQHLGVRKEPYEDIQFCAGGMFGFVRSAPAYDLVAKQAALCAMRPSCYSPPGGGRDNHNFDQSINSILVYKYGMHCTHDRAYREMEMARCPLRHDRFVPEEDGGVVLCIRRWHQPKPYPHNVRFNEGCRSYMCADGSTPVHQVKAAWIYAVEDRGSLIEHTQGSHLPGRSPMAACLLANHNYRPNCTAEIAGHHRSMRGQRVWMGLISRLDAMRALLVAGLRLPFTYVLFACMWVAVLRRTYGMAWINKHRISLTGAWVAAWCAVFTLIQFIDSKFDK